MRILLVDDDPEIGLGLRTALARRGHQVDVVASVAAARAALEVSTPDVGIVDIMLPDGDGFTLCREIRSRWSFPTVMLTARDEDVDIVGGLEAGADDYVVKPVSPAVLEARLRTVVRRATGPAAEHNSAVVVGQLTIDAAAMEVRVGQRCLELSATEFKLLQELVAHRGTVLSRAQLIDRVWAETPPNTERVVDTALQRLRAKLAEAGVEQPQVQTLRGLGYRLR